LVSRRVQIADVCVRSSPATRVAVAEDQVASAPDATTDDALGCCRSASSRSAARASRCRPLGRPLHFEDVCLDVMSEEVRRIARVSAVDPARSVADGVPGLLMGEGPRLTENSRIRAGQVTTPERGRSACSSTVWVWPRHFLSEQGVAAVTGSIGPDLVGFGKMGDVFGAKCRARKAMARRPVLAAAAPH